VPRSRSAKAEEHRYTIDFDGSAGDSVSLWGGKPSTQTLGLFALTTPGIDFFRTRAEALAGALRSRSDSRAEEQSASPRGRPYKKSVLQAVLEARQVEKRAIAPFGEVIFDPFCSVSFNKGANVERSSSHINHGPNTLIAQLV
jgi:hypothetical protein